MTLADTNRQVRFVIHDRDTKFTAALDEVFSVDGIRIIKTPVRAPRANAVAERWIRSARGELSRLAVELRGGPHAAAQGLGPDREVSDGSTTEEDT
jgi:hypothetical protein